MADAFGDISTERIDRFLAEENPTLPCVVVDLSIVRQRYRLLRAHFPSAEIFYAVKANPAEPVVAALGELGANFDLASLGEMERCFGARVPPERLSYGNTVKREAGIVAAYARGVRLFAFDTGAELEKLARVAPGSEVFCRLMVRNTGAEWPLSHKFGCDRHTAIDLLVHAKSLGLRPVGVSFHVGSQQTDPSQWLAPIQHAAEIFRSCAHRGVHLSLLNLGGGLPAHYRAPVPDIGVYAATIERQLAASFGSSRPRIILEPGRYMVGDAGILRSEVLLAADRPHPGGHRWVYLTCGRYNGLPETQGEAIRYRIRTSRDGGPIVPTIVAGPTCDSTDIVYERSDYRLPADLTEGDTVDFLSAGAYTASYASVEFNGFPPIETHCID